MEFISGRKYEAAVEALASISAGFEYNFMSDANEEPRDGDDEDDVDELIKNKKMPSIYGSYCK